MVNIITQSKGKKTCNGDAISNLYEKRLSTRSWAMGAAQTLALHWKQLEKDAGGLEKTLIRSAPGGQRSIRTREEDVEQTDQTFCLRSDDESNCLTEKLPSCTTLGVADC